MSTSKETFTNVSATGTAETTYKSVTFSMTITARGKDNAEARAKIDVTHAELRKTIIALNKGGARIDEAGMKIGYETQPWNEYNQLTREQENKGYQVTASLNCTTEKVDAATVIMDALTKINGAIVASPNFTADDSAAARKNAFQAAFDRAMEDFRLQCSVLGENPDVYMVASYSPTAAAYRPPMETRAMAVAASAPAAPPTEIKAGKAEITSSVTLNFVKKPLTSRLKSSTSATSGSAKGGNGRPTRSTNVG
jgi:uncharacterized protein YggE